MAGKGKGKVKEDAPAIPTPVARFSIRDERKLEANYDKCVTDIIATMDSSTDVKFRFKVDGKDITIPVTPGKDNTSRGTYVIEITNGELSLFLVGTRYQAWFRGFVTNKGRRYEVEEEPPKVMNGSKSLHTNGMYPHLINGGVAELKLGYQRLLQAFYALATHGEDGNDEVTPEIKEAIAVLVVMLFEGPRFPDVRKFVKGLLKQTTDGVVGEKRGKLINSWGSTSELFYSENENNTRIVVSKDSMQILKDVAYGFRILCRSKWDKLIAEQSGKTGGSSSKSKK